MTKKANNDVQNVRICLNQISMDNYDRMKTKLRKLLFGERLTFSERVATLKKKEEQEELKKEL